MLEHFFQCPHCWEEISMLLDRSANQTYIEDCEVCCNPIEITVKLEAGNLVEFRTETLDQ